MIPAGRSYCNVSLQLFHELYIVGFPQASCYKQQTSLLTEIRKALFLTDQMSEGRVKSRQ